MATAREENGYENGGGGYGKFRKQPLKRTQTTPYDRPPTALRNPNRNNGWLSKLIDPAQRLITYSAHKLFSSVFRKRLNPPPPSETVQEARGNRQEAAIFVANESSGQQQRVLGESSDPINLSDGVGLPELEEVLKAKTFTRSEIDHLVELMHSRSVDTAVGEEGKKTEVVPLESMLPLNQKEEYPRTPAVENGIKIHHVSTSHATSSVSVEDVASPVQLAKAYIGSRPSKVSPLMLSMQSPTGEDSTLLKGHHFAQKSPIMSVVPRAINHTRVYENGFLTPRSRGRSVIYNMARTPYPRVYPDSTPKGAGVGVEDGPSSSSQHAHDHGVLSGTKQGGLKRRSTVLGNDIGSFGPIRRIRHKASLLSSKGLTLTNSDIPVSITSSGIDAVQQPSSSMQKPILTGEVKHSRTKSSAENDHTMPSSSFPPLPSKSSEMASKILQQVDKMVSPKEKSSVLRLPHVNDNYPSKLSSSMLRGQALRSMETVDSSKLLDNLHDNELNGTPRSLSASAQKLTSKVSKVENGLKPVSLNDGLIPAVTGSDSPVPRNQVISIGKSRDSSDPPSKKRAFCMSAHEDYMELDDDDAYPNENASPFSTPAAEKTTFAIEKPVQETPPGSSVGSSSKSFIADGKLRNADGSIVDEKVDTPTPITSSIVAGSTAKPNTGSVKASTHTILDSDKSTPNGSAANPPLFNLGKNFVPSTELSGDDAPSVNFGFNKNIDSVPQVPFTFSSSVGGESTFSKFGGASDSKLSSISELIQTFNAHLALSSSSASTSEFSFGASTPVASTSSPMVFGSSTGASAPKFSFTSAAANTNTQPAFGNPSPVFPFGSASVNNDQTSMEDNMAEDTFQATPPITPVFGQQPVAVQSNFVFGGQQNIAPQNPFHFRGQQNIVPQNPSPFQASGSLKFNAGGSFSLGTVGVDKSSRKRIRIWQQANLLLWVLPVSSNNGTSSTLFGAPIWQPSKSSPLGTPFSSSLSSSSASSSEFSFGASTPVASTSSPMVFGGQHNIAPQNPFQFGGQQNIAPQNPSPFQASGSLEFNAGGSFSLGTGGVDRSSRKRIRSRRRKR